MSTADAIEDIQADLTDINVRELEGHLSAAECCSSREDMEANLSEALAAAKALVRDIARLQRKLAKAKDDAEDAAQERDDAEDLGHSN